MHGHFVHVMLQEYGGNMRLGCSIAIVSLVALGCGSGDELAVEVRVDRGDREIRSVHCFGTEADVDGYLNYIDRQGSEWLALDVEKDRDRGTARVKVIKFAPNNDVASLVDESFDAQSSTSLGSRSRGVSFGPDLYFVRLRGVRDNSDLACLNAGD